jgi:hypothetical protein
VRLVVSNLRSARIYVGLYVVGLLVFGSVAGGPLWTTSSAPHFVYQADAWLHGHLDIRDGVAGDDWAKLETVVLDSGETVQGRRLTTRPAFKVVGGGEIPLQRVKQTIGSTLHMTFPPMPALLMIPQVLISGRAANDTLFTVLFAALLLPLGFATLRKLKSAGLSQRSVGDDLWLTAMLGFGTVFFFSAVQGKVWFTAHIVGVVFAAVYAWASIGASRPLLAGLALACAATTRTPMSFMFPLFLLESWRVLGGLDQWRENRASTQRALLRQFAKFAAPVAVIGVAAAVYNYVRFASPTEFGHSYLDVIQQQQIERYGLFGVHYLSRNLAVAFTLLPDFIAQSPYVLINRHGTALWFTTPIFLTLLWPRVRTVFSRSLWITVAMVAIPTLFYQNSGFVQFGYRFSLDYTVFLVLLIAVGGRPLSKLGKALIVAGIVINLFGAVTFAHRQQHYVGAFNVVVPN